MKRLLRSKIDYKKIILRNQLTSLILFESVTTTSARAKKLAQFANNFFNRIRKGSLNEIKLAHQTLFNKKAVKKSFEEILPRYSKNDTTFVKIIKANSRRGDNAPQSIVVWLRGLEAEISKNTSNTKENGDSNKED